MIRVIELTGVHCYLLLSLSLNAKKHIISHFLSGKVTKVSELNYLHMHADLEFQNAYTYVLSKVVLGVLYHESLTQT